MPVLLTGTTTTIRTNILGTTTPTHMRVVAMPTRITATRITAITTTITPPAAICRTRWC